MAVSTYEAELRHYTVRERMEGGWEVLFDGKDWLQATHELPVGSECSAMTRKGAQKIAKRLARLRAENAVYAVADGPEAEIPATDLRAVPRP